MDQQKTLIFQCFMQFRLLGKHPTTAQQEQLVGSLRLLRVGQLLGDNPTTAKSKTPCFLAFPTWKPLLLGVGWERAFFREFGSPRSRVGSDESLAGRDDGFAWWLTWK